MNAPPFPLNPSVGEFFQNWVWNGQRWVASAATGVRVVTQVFNASGPYQPSPGLISCVVECIGGGGGGGSAINNLTGQQWVIMAGGGGGSGSYSRQSLAAALVLGGVNVVVGAGGVGSAGPAPSGNGGTTSFGAFCVANGGFGGTSMDAGVNLGAPGDGGNAGVGEVAWTGATGHQGTNQASTAEMNMGAAGGIGGAVFGGNGSYATNPLTTITGAAGDPNSGAGGQGGVNNQHVPPATGAGGSGGSGICIVTEYCWADSADGGDCVNPTFNVNARVAIERDGWPGHGHGPHKGGPAGFLEGSGDDFDD